MPLKKQGMAERVLFHLLSSSVGQGWRQVSTMATPLLR